MSITRLLSPEQFRNEFLLFLAAYAPDDTTPEQLVSMAMPTLKRMPMQESYREEDVQKAVAIHKRGA